MLSPPICMLSLENCAQSQFSGRIRQWEAVTLLINQIGWIFQSNLEITSIGIVLIGKEEDKADEDEEE